MGSGRKFEQQSTPCMLAESLTEMSKLVKGIAEKSDRLEAFSQSSHDSMYARLTMLETTCTTGCQQGWKG